MTCTAATRKEARAIATRLRRLYEADGYEVVIAAPIFPGDAFHVYVR